jgi:hypothetical protein
MAASDSPAISSLDESVLESRQIPDERGNVYMLISVHCNLYHRFVMWLKSTGVGLLEDLEGHASITLWVQE